MRRSIIDLAVAMTVSFGAAGVLTQAAAADKNWTAPGYKSNAQVLSDETMKAHPELLSVTIHGTPPGLKEIFTMYAGSFPDRIGNADDPDDIDVIKKGITILDPRWKRVNDDPKKFVVLMPMRDAKNENIGLVVYAFKLPTPGTDDERKYFADSMKLRDELAKKIPSESWMFEKAS